VNEGTPGVDALLCRACGTRNAALSSGGLVVVVDPADHEQLRALFTGALDALRCENAACGQALPARPTVAVLSVRDRAAVVVRGTPLAAADSLFGWTSAALKQQGISLREVDDPEALRVWILQRWAPYRDLLMAVFAARSAGEDVATIAARERAWLTPSFFAAAWLMVSTPLPGLFMAAQDGSGAQVPADVVLALLAELQSAGWYQLCTAWGSGATRPSFERDLEAHVHRGALLPGAVERCLEVLTALAGVGPLSRPLAYASSALRASLCSAAGLPDEGAQMWAERWLDVELLAVLSGEDLPSRVPAGLRVSAERARSTVDSQALRRAAATRFAQLGPGVFGALDAAARRCGVDGLAHELVEALVPVVDGQRVPVADVLAALQPSAAQSGLGPTLSTAEKFLPVLEGDDLARTVWTVADEIGTWFDGSREVQARVEAWAGSSLHRHWLPQPFLDRVGERARSWESEVSLHGRLHLWTERSNALRLSGRPQEAAEIVQSLLAEADSCPAAVSGSQRLVLGRNLAVLQRELGDREGALAAQRRLVEQAEVGERAEVLDTVVTTLLDLGRPEEALKAAEQAWRLGRHRSDLRARLAVTMAAALTAAGEADRAEQHLLALRAGDLANVGVLLPYASALFTLVSTGRESRELGRALSEVVHRLQELHDASWQSRAVALHEGVLRLLAALGTWASLPGARHLWEALDVLSVELRDRRDAMALLAIAGHAAQDGEVDGLRSLLDAAVVAFAAEHEDSRELAAVVGTTDRLQWLLARLTDGVVAHAADPEVLRVLAELQRDLLGRLEPGAVGAPTVLPWDDVLAARTADGPVVVLEALETSHGLRLLRTTVTGDGTSTTATLDAPASVDLAQLAVRVEARLQNWRPGRRGDPFDLPAWQSFAAWVVDAVQEVAAPGAAHVVVLEHARFAGLPWHVGTGPCWTTSYSPSWSQVLRPSRAAAGSRAGVVVVPRFTEHPAVLSAFAGSTGRARQLPAPWSVEVLEGAAADRPAVVRLLETSDVVLLLCHGAVQADEKVVSWLLAADGVLPLRGAAASAAEQGRQHRFTWEDCDRLRSAPALVLSGACSTGLSYSKGVGEQLGLFSALRRHGTRAMIAPRWDVPAAEVLPVLDDVLVRIAAGASVRAAVRDACRQAEERLPTWMAWALSLQGDE
jgi:tetratricopeptide (TPR) repeat protein